MNRPHSLCAITICMLIWLGSPASQAEGATKPIRLVNTQVTLPTSTTSFPPGKGSEIANAYCTICHSSDMVTQQPPSLTRKDWQSEVHKMKTNYGAPIPDDQVTLLVTYLTATFSDKK